MNTFSHVVTGKNIVLVVGHPKGKIVTYAGKAVHDGVLHIAHKNRGNFANNTERAREAGRKGGKARGGWSRPMPAPQCPMCDSPMLRIPGHLKYKCKECEHDGVDVVAEIKLDGTPKVSIDS